MNTNTVVGIIVAVVIIGGGIWYFAGQGAATEESTEMATGTDTGTGDTGTGPSGSGSIAALAALGGSYECNVSIDNASAPTTGTVEIADGKMHGVFTMTMADKTIHAYLVNDGTYIYSWTDMAPQGAKIAVTSTTAAGSASAGGVDANTAVNYTCAPWATDPAAFVPPTNVTFMAVGGTP